MLRRLYIKNYALIEEITVNFDRGLSIITGETGAGKSILLDAISLLIGERASTDFIRHGQSKSIVEAEFDRIPSDSVRSFLKTNNIESEDDTIIIRRELNQKGSSRAFINDSPVQLTLLKQIGEALIDLHGQHEHQSLLHQELHINFLDEYAKLIPERNAYQSEFAEFTKLRSSLEQLVENRAQLAREREFLEFKFQELKSVDPKENEDQENERELLILEHSEELGSLTGELYDDLYESEDSVHSQLGKAKLAFERLKKIDATFIEQEKELLSAIAIISELSHTLSAYHDGVESQPERLAVLRQRQVALTRLKKKYGPTLEHVIATYAELEEQLGDTSSIEEKIDEVGSTLAKQQTKTEQLALKLSSARKRYAKSFEKKIVEELQTLGIENAQFVIDFESQQLSTTGVDRVAFLLSSNKGEDPKPLVKVASGGEVSRIMLALKTVLADGDTIPLMIFDEIDAGISGRIAQRVGKAMKSLTANHQIIAITHLGQIAAFADTHFVVEKSSNGDSTTSVLRKLSDSEHESAIASLISGSVVTDHSLNAARSLVQEASNLVSA
ncbi:MAG: DNA repair protein RecN [bacterium]